MGNHQGLLSEYSVACPLPLTSEAKMEPPIQGLNLRSMVLLLAMSFSRMLWGRKGSGRKWTSRSWAGTRLGRQEEATEAGALSIST